MTVADCDLSVAAFLAKLDQGGARLPDGPVLCQPADVMAAFKLTVQLLETLAAKQERVTLPVLKTSQRRRSGLRSRSQQSFVRLRVTACPQPQLSGLVGLNTITSESYYDHQLRRTQTCPTPTIEDLPESLDDFGRFCASL